MTQEEKNSIADLPETIRSLADKSFQLWKSKQEIELEGANAITKNWFLNSVVQDLIFARGSYYYRFDHKTKEPFYFTIPQFSQEFVDSRLDHWIEKIDADGKRLSQFDRSRIGFVFMVRAIDWCNEQFERLQGVAPLREDLSDLRSRNPWGLTNDQVVLMVQIGLHAAGIETDTQQRHIANLTRLLHMLLEVETDSKLNGSGYYGPFKAGMSGKEVRGTLEDLRTIRPIFEKFGYNKGVKLIDERLRREKNAAK